MKWSAVAALVFLFTFTACHSGAVTPGAPGPSLMRATLPASEYTKTAFGPKLAQVAGLAVGPGGALYVVQSNGDVSIIALDGTVRTLGITHVFGPEGIAVDGGGNVFVGIQTNGGFPRFALRWFSINSSNHEIFTGHEGMAWSPAVDLQGNLYFTNPYISGNRIFKIPAGNRCLTRYDVRWNNCVIQDIGSGLFSGTKGVAVDLVGNLWVSDTGNGRVKKLDPKGSVIATYSGFEDPRGITVDGAGVAYIADRKNKDVKMISTNGAITTIASGLEPTWVAVDRSCTKHCSVFVNETYGNTIWKLTPP